MIALVIRSTFDSRWSESQQLLEEIHFAGGFARLGTLFRTFRVTSSAGQRQSDVAVEGVVDFFDSEEVEEQ